MSPTERGFNVFRAGIMSNKLGGRRLNFFSLKCRFNLQNLLKIYSKSTWNVLEMYSKRTWNVLEMNSKCTRNVLEMYSKCTWNVLEMYSKCTRNVLEMYLKCTWNVIEMYSLPFPKILKNNSNIVFLKNPQFYHIFDFI